MPPTHDTTGRARRRRWSGERPLSERAVSASHLRTSAGKVVELVGHRKQHLASHVARLTGTHTAGVEGLLIAFHPRARVGDAAYLVGGGHGGDFAVPGPSLGIEGCR
jgi:hypothetical protein